MGGKYGKRRTWLLEGAPRRGGVGREKAAAEPPHSKKELPGGDGYYVWGAGVAVDDVGFDDGFEVFGGPVAGELSQQGIEVLGIGNEFAGGFGTFGEQAAEENDGLAGEVVADAGDDGVVLGELRVRNLPDVHPGFLR